MFKIEISPNSLSMRTHHKVCYKPGYPDRNHNVGPHWLEPYTCTVVLLPFHSCTVSPSRSKDRCTVCSSSELLGTGGILALPVWTWNLYCGRLSRHNTTPAVVDPARLSSGWRPQLNPLLCLGRGWCLGIHLGHGQGPGFNLSEAEAKGGLKLFPSLSFIWPHVPAFVCEQDVKDTRDLIFVLRYVACL